MRTKVKPNDFDDLRKIGSVHTIRNLSDLKLDFIDDTPKRYTVRVVDTLKKKKRVYKIDINNSNININ